MKSIIKVLLLSFITTISYSQNKTESKSSEEFLNNINLPEIEVISHLTNYVRDINVDSKVVVLQNEFIEYNLLIKPADYKDSFVTFKLKRGNGKLVAYYNENGKLASVAEQYKNVVLPISVSRSVYKAYPGWQIEKDKYIYSQEKGSVTNKEYILTMTKDRKTKKVSVNPENMAIASL